MMRGRVAPLLSAPTPLQSLLARRWRPQWVCRECRHRQQPRRSSTTTTSPSTASTDPSAKPFYATTPIFYVNAAPHVGHMYTMILTDVLKRWQTLQKRPAILCTGTDEHGMKVQQAAGKAGVEAKDFCDAGAEVFRELAAKIDISNDIFIRTTEPKHRDAVEYAWHLLEQRGYIYASKHDGWYSVSDETFVPAAQVQLIVDPPTGRKIMVSVETGKEVEWSSERNYHFRLSAFQERLLDFYRKNPTFIIPKSRMKEIVRQVKSGLEDLSVSRPVERLSWGIRVPTDPSQTIYVWLDALLNYATAVGYPFHPGSEGAGGWPADVHVVGKDIIRFHAIYWPAFLMALDLPLPKHLLTHAHWTLGRQKMAKSTGNVVNPFFALERFGVDVMRWYLVHDGGITDDADYDNRFIIDKYKKSLQGGLGNLTSRIMRGIGWNVPRAVQRFAHPAFNPSDGPDRDQTAYKRLCTLPEQVDNHMRELAPNKALQTIMTAIYNTNAYMQQASPWDLTKTLETGTANASADSSSSSRSGDVEAELDRVIYLCAENLRLSGIMLQPFMPTAAGRMLDMLGVAHDRRDWESCEVGRDGAYGTPLVELGRGAKGTLFPGLTSAF